MQRNLDSLLGPRSRLPWKHGNLENSLAENWMESTPCVAQDLKASVLTPLTRSLLRINDLIDFRNGVELTLALTTLIFIWIKLVQSDWTIISLRIVLSPHRFVFSILSLSSPNVTFLRTVVPSLCFFVVLKKRFCHGSVVIFLFLPRDMRRSKSSGTVAPSSQHKNRCFLILKISSVWDRCLSGALSAWIFLSRVLSLHETVVLRKYFFRKTQLRCAMRNYNRIMFVCTLILAHIDLLWLIRQ